MQNYKETHRHLIEHERIELACDYLVHEFRKIFRDTARDKAYYAVKKQAPTETNSDDVTIRDFWNLFCSMSSGWRLKDLFPYATAENVMWEKSETNIELLVPEAPQGWMAKITPYNFKEAVDYLRDKDKLREAIEDTRKY